MGDGKTENVRGSSFSISNMKCYICNSKSKVTETREYMGNVYRRHICLTCGEVFFSEEMLMSKEKGGKMIYRTVADIYSKNKRRKRNDRSKNNTGTNKKVAQSQCCATDNANSGSAR